MFQHGGYWWPDGIKPTSPDHALRRRDAAFAAMARYFPNADQRRLCVTAGGMNGLWTLRYLDFFEHVVTFEPAPHVWECLQRNLTEIQKLGIVQSFPAALGAFSCKSGIVINEVGSSYIDAGAPQPVQVVTLDSLELVRCDWLQFDLEGYEYPALVGATHTIMRYSPTIQLEMNGCADKRGYAFGERDVRQFLDGLGYVELERIPGNDVIFRRLTR